MVFAVIQDSYIRIIIHSKFKTRTFITEIEKVDCI